METNPFEVLEKKLGRIETMLVQLRNEKHPQKIKRIVGINEFSQYSGWSKSKLYIDLSRGVKIPGSFKDGGKWFFNLDQFDTYRDDLSIR